MSVPGTYSSMMMATGTIPSLVGVGAFTVADAVSGVAQTLALPSGITTGDYLVVIFQVSTRNSATSSLTTITSVTAGGGGPRLYISSGAYSGSAPTVTVTGNLQLVAFCIGLRGVTAVDTSTTGTLYSMSAGSGNTVANVTTGVNNTYVITAVAHDLTTSSSSIFSAWANADLEGITELGERSTTFSDDGGFGAVGGLKKTSGATSDTTYTSALSDSGMVRLSVSFKGS